MKTIWSAIAIVALATWVGAQETSRPATQPAPATQEVPAAMQAAPAPHAVRGRVLVLPFAALGDGGREWIGSAIQNNLLAELGRRPGVQAVEFKDRPVGVMDLAQAIALGREADAEYVIYGTYQIIEDGAAQLRITGTVLEVARETTAGGLKATGALRDLFALEDVIAQQADRALQGKGTDKGQEAVAQAQQMLRQPAAGNRPVGGAVGLYQGSALQRAVETGYLAAAPYMDQSSRQRSYNNYNYSYPYYSYPYGGYYPVYGYWGRWRGWRGQWSCPTLGGSVVTVPVVIDSTPDYSKPQPSNGFVQGYVPMTIHNPPRQVIQNPPRNVITPRYENVARPRYRNVATPSDSISASPSVQNPPADQPTRSPTRGPAPPVAGGINRVAGPLNNVAGPRE